MEDQAFPDPLWLRAQRGDKLTLMEKLRHYVVAPIRLTLAGFYFGFRSTPALRERCIKYALEAGCKDQWDIGSLAVRLENHITGKERFR